MLTEETILVSIKDVEGNIRSLNSLVLEILKQTIALCDGNVSLAAKKLKIGRSTLYRRLENAKEPKPSG